MLLTKSRKVLLLILGIIFLIVNYLFNLNISIFPNVLIVVSVLLILKTNKKKETKKE